MVGNNKIAFLCHPYHRGGVTRWMVDAAEEFAHRGYETYFVTVDPVKHFFSAGGRPKLISLLERSLKKLKIIAVKVDLFFEFGTVDYKTHIYVSQILKSVPLGTPIILSDDIAVWNTSKILGDSYPIIGVLHSDEAYYYEVTKKYYQYLRSLVTVSWRIADKIKSNIVELNKPVSVIPCGIPIPIIVSKDEEPVKKIRLIWVGRVDEKQKRVSDLIKIASILKSKKIDFELEIIGNGPDSKYIEEQIIANSLASEIFNCGWLDSVNVFKRLANSDILILPSNYEGMPIIVIEALSMGCAVVASKVSGVEDLEEHPLSKKCLRLFPVGDISMAVKLIEEVADLDETSRRLSARQLAESEFSIQSCVSKYENVIDTCKVENPKSKFPNYAFSKIDKLLSDFRAILRYLKVNVLTLMKD